MEKVVDIVADEEGVVATGELDEGLTAVEREGFPGGVGAGCDEVDDVFVVLSVWAGVLEGLLKCMSARYSFQGGRM